MAKIYSRDFLKDLVLYISQIEKRYGRSIVNIRRQEEIWLEMLESEEVFLSGHIVDSFPENKVWSLNGALSSGEEFSSIFDLAKHIASLGREGMSLGVDARGYQFALSDWKAFFTLIKAASSQKNKLSVSIDVENASIMHFLQAAIETQPEVSFSFILSQEFMDALQDGGEFSLFSGGLHKGKTIKASTVLSGISSLARAGQRVYFVFNPSVEALNPIPHIGQMNVLSPEGPFLSFPREAFPSLRLNMLKMLKMNGLNREIDWERLADRVGHSVRLLDNMIDLDDFPSREAFALSKKIRRVFLGISNWAEALFYLGIPYSSDAAVELGAKLSEFVAREAEQASWDLAKERGIFSLYRGSVLETKGLRRRNLSVYGVFEDGIAPMDRLVDEEEVLYPLLDEISKQRGFFDEALKKFASENGSIAQMEGLPEDVKQVFVCDRDISPLWKMKMLAAFQSQSHNLASMHFSFSDASAENLTNIILQGSLMGASCLSVSSQLTVHQEVISSEKETSKAQSIARSFSPRVRPEVLTGTTVKMDIACGELLVTINRDQSSEPIEVLMSLSKSSPCVSAHIEAISKMVSLSLASGVDIQAIVSSLKGISCPVTSFKGARKITSCADALSYVLEEMFPSVASAPEEESREEVLPKGLFKEN